MDALARYGKVTKNNQETLVIEHAAMVKRLAYHLLGRLPQHVQLDDLIQAGMEGLLDAARHFDASKGASFETYAAIRIRGQMLDEVRRNDWVPRSVYRNARTLAAAVQRAENRLGREATDAEIAAESGLSQAEYFAILRDSAGTNIMAFDDIGMVDDTMQGVDSASQSEPQLEAMREELRSRLAAVIDHLPERERLVMSLYYEQDLNLKEIGQVIGVGESRVSQLLSQAVLRIQSRLLE
ncbi:MAG: RNA polymerase sigma factor FliA [Legionellaceae bacterium]|nr:RNA polymerase sigma factor FliA [Legionellaceae bacterium]